MEPKTSHDLAREFIDTWTRIGTAVFVGGRPSDGIDLSDNQLLILYLLEKDAPCRVGVLAERAGISVPVLSRTLGSLERRGYVGRTADPADRRATLTSLSDDGRAVVALHRSRLIAAATDLLARISPDAQVEAVGCLRRLDELLRS